MFIFVFFLNLALADESALTLEKTFSRDNTFCYFKKKKIEINIRGDNRFTEPKEKGQGKYLFYRTNRKFLPLEINKDRFDDYRFFSAKKTNCSKTHAFTIHKNNVAILLLKDNAPFRNQLVVQHFDFETLTPGLLIETRYTAVEAEAFPGGFVFKNVPDRAGFEMGKVEIEGSSFTYQDREFPEWITYGEQGFKVHPQMTYKKSPWKRFFQNEKAFLNAADWDVETASFKNRFFYLAVNHKQNRKCVLILPIKKKLTGSENWNCAKSI